MLAPPWARPAVDPTRTLPRLYPRRSRARGCAGSSEHVHHESLLLCRSTMESVPASASCIIGLWEEHGGVLRMIRAVLRRRLFPTEVPAHPTEPVVCLLRLDEGVDHLRGWWFSSLAK